MEDEFTLTIDYKGEPRHFNAKLLVQGYTHKFCVTVNETEIFFEPDEEGQYRAIKMPCQQEQQFGKMDASLLQAIAQKIEAIVH